MGRRNGDRRWGRPHRQGRILRQGDRGPRRRRRDGGGGAQGVQQVEDAGEAVRRPAFEAPQDRPAPGGGEIGGVNVGRRRRLLEPLHRGGEGIGAVEGEAAGDHLVKHDAEGVEVGGGGDLRRPLHLLRRHVGRRTDDSGAGDPRRQGVGGAGPPGDAEVGHHRPHAAAVLRHEEDVLGLEVPVDDPGPVGSVEGGGHLLQKRQAGLGGHPPLPPQPLGQGLPLEQLHGQEGYGVAPSPVLTEVEDAADVGVGHQPGEGDLPLETVDGAGLLLQVGAHRLEGDPLPQLQILGLVDLPHAAAGQKAHDAIAAGEDVVGPEGRLRLGPAAAGAAGAHHRRPLGLRHGAGGGGRMVGQV
ncbi:MAG: hypothetical protein AAGD06_12360 [Acidobacteriota bacterium]